MGVHPASPVEVSVCAVLELSTEPVEAEADDEEPPEPLVVFPPSDPEVVVAELPTAVEPDSPTLLLELPPSLDPGMAARSEHAASKTADKLRRKERRTRAPTPVRQTYSASPPGLCPNAHPGGSDGARAGRGSVRA